MLVQILSTVLGLILVLSLLSLLATALMEWISALLKLKNRHLEEVLHNVLASTDVNARVYNDFVNHSRYRQLSAHPLKKKSGPSYLKPEDFQAILFDLLTQYHGGPIVTSQDLYESINVLPDVDLKHSLNSLSSEVNGDPNGFRFKVQDWFAGVMESSGVWYKYRTRRVLFALGVLVAVVFNADTVKIFQALQVSPGQTRQVLGLVAQFAPAAGRPANAMVNPATPEPFSPSPYPEPQPFQAPDTDPQPFTPPSISTEAGSVQSVNPQPASPPANSSAEAGAGTNNFYLATKPIVNRLINRDLVLAESPLGIGWSNVDPYSMDRRAWTVKLLGWLLTALAVSFGAEFWFDILKRVVSRRSRTA